MQRFCRPCGILLRGTCPSLRKPRQPCTPSAWRHQLDILEIVRAAALDKKAEDLTEIDVAGRTIIADTFVIVTGRSKIQTRSIADSIAEKIEENGLRVSRVEGYADGNWILIDIGNVVVHVFTPEQRAFYNLERLWAAAKEAQTQIS
ncbi:MAG TPA: ribosome silencing factor [Candidatus Baltobacteraceae bacterium]